MSPSFYPNGGLNFTNVTCGYFYYYSCCLMVDEHMDSESGLVIAHSQREKKLSEVLLRLSVGYGRRGRLQWPRAEHHGDAQGACLTLRADSRSQLCTCSLTAPSFTINGHQMYKYINSLIKPFQESDAPQNKMRQFCSKQTLTSSYVENKCCKSFSLVWFILSVSWPWEDLIEANL